MTRASLIVFSYCAVLGFGCAANDQVDDGQPFHVRNAQFMRGPLPGQSPDDGGDAGMGMGSKRTITLVTVMNLVAQQGQGDKKVSGLASADTSAVAIELKGVGDGYWVVPTGIADLSSTDGELTWSASVDIGDIAPGKHQLRFVAIDEQGRAGEQKTQELCVVGEVPDNLHACDPERPLPAVVISLTWDVDADLDLQVVDPSHQVIDAKNPMTVAANTDGTLPPGAGVIDRDSNAACHIDGARSENLVWIDEKPKGRYGIYVNMFDPCKQSAANFRVAVYTAVSDGHGGTKAHLLSEHEGTLLDLSANGGAARGLFVTDVTFK